MIDDKVTNVHPFIILDPVYKEIMKDEAEDLFHKLIITNTDLSDYNLLDHYTDLGIYTDDKYKCQIINSTGNV